MSDKQRRILVVRPQAGQLSTKRLLKAEGYAAIAAPLIAIEAIDKDAFFNTKPFRWIAITSANAARMVGQQDHWHIDEYSQFAALGDATAKALRAAGFEPAFISTKHSAEGLGKEIPASPSDQVLYPCSTAADDSLEMALHNRGVAVHRHPIYTILQQAPDDELMEEIAEGGMDAVLLYSPSGAAAFHRFFGHTSFTTLASIVCIGEKTAQAADALGLKVACIAADPSDAAMIAALNTLWNIND